MLVSPANPTCPLCDQTLPEHQGQGKSSSSTSDHPKVDSPEDKGQLCPFYLLLSLPWPQVLYRWNRQGSTSVIETNKTSVELSLPFEEDYIIEIKPFSDGGDGSSSEQIRIPKISSKDGEGLDGEGLGSVPPADIPAPRSDLIPKARFSHKKRPPKQFYLCLRFPDSFPSPFLVLNVLFHCNSL